MPTVIDQLLITLGLDASSFEAGQKKSTAAIRAFKQAAKEAVVEVLKAEREKAAAAKQAAQDAAEAAKKAAADKKQADKDAADAAKKAAADQKQADKDATNAQKQAVKDAKQAAKDQQKAAEDLARAKEKAVKEAEAAEKQAADEAKAREKARANEEKKQADDQEKQQKEAIDRTGKLRNELLGLFAIFTAGRGLRSFIADTVSAEASTGRLAASLTLSTETLSEWEGAAQRVGGSAQATAGSLQNLTNSYEELLTTGQSSIVPALRFLGITNADQLKDLPTLLLSVANAFKAMDPRLAMTIGQQMGLDPGTIRLLEQGREGVELLLEQQHRLGNTTQEDAEAGIALQRAWLDLTQSSGTLGRRILTDLTPALVGFLQVLTRVMEWLVAHPRVAEAAFAALTGAILALSVALTGGLVAALGAVAGGFGLAVSAGGALLGVLGYVVARFTGLGKYLGLTGGSSIEVGNSPIADQTMTAPKKAFLDALSAPESKGNYSAINPTSGAFGRYQFLPSTWQEVSTQLGLTDRSPVSQDRAAWFYAAQRYRAATGGRSLEADVAEGGHGAQIAAALRGLWPSLPGGSQQLETQQTLDKNLAMGISRAPIVGAASVPSLVQNSNSNSQLSSSNSSTTNIGVITVNTQATDANGVARGISSAIEKYAYVPQANTGLR